jgi:hypothetical protein
MDEGLELEWDAEGIWLFGRMSHEVLLVPDWYWVARYSGEIWMVLL